MAKEKILLDTDIGSDIDDSVALAYLLMQKNCDLLGITTVSGEAEKRAMMASAMLYTAGKESVPVFAGLSMPTLTKSKQPTAQQWERVRNWKHDEIFRANEYLEFMRDTITKNPGEVTLLAIGPMTNVGLLFAAYPEVPTLLKRLVLMNGMFYGDTNEWNSANDPYASAFVYHGKAPVHRSVGLDVTMQVQMDADEVRQRFTHPILKPVLDFASVWFEHTKKIVFHDPLAAATIFDEDICGFERGNVNVELFDKDNLGVTHFTPDENGAHEVAKTVDKGRFFRHWFSVFDN